jgi:hypothetical protein
MPPQQGERLLDLFDGTLSFRAHDVPALANDMVAGAPLVKSDRS